LSASALCPLSCVSSARPRAHKVGDPEVQAAEGPQAASAKVVGISSTPRPEAFRSLAPCFR
jgi:hypothetical protein